MVVLYSSRQSEGRLGVFGRRLSNQFFRGQKRKGKEDEKRTRRKVEGKYILANSKNVTISELIFIF